MKQILLSGMIMVTVCAGLQKVKAQAQKQDSLRKQNLQGVTVRGTKPYVVLRADKTILNVSESPVAAGGDALQVISHAPGVIEQGNGSFELKGKKVIVLIDGKDSRLSGEDLSNWLSAMPANSIDKVELISNLTAKYDARGAAVINIITARNKNYGTNGTLTLGAGAGSYARYNGGLALNYRNKRINAYGSYDYQYNKQYIDLRSERQLGNKAQILENSFDLRTRNNHALRAGMDVDISRNSTVGITVRGQLNYRDRSVSAKSVKEDGTEAGDSFSTVSTLGRLRIFNPVVNIYYKVNLDSTGKQLTLNADYFNYNKDWSDDFITRFYDAPGKELQLPYILRDNSPADNTIKSLSADYTQPLGKGRLEAGLKATMTTTDNDVRWEQQLDSKWVTDAGKTNHFIYKENIYAAYASYSRTIKKFGLQLGLRAEQTNTTGTSVTLQQENKRDQLNFFPNASLTYSQSQKHQYGISYRKSIDRFSFNVVNPFVTYVSQYFYYQGNPNIKPSIGHSLELSYTYNNELMAALGYQHYSGALASIYRKDTGDVVIGTDANLKSGDALNVSLTWSKALLNNKWTSTNTAMFTYAKYNEPGSGLDNAGEGIYLNTSNMFVIAKGFNAELSGTYISPMAFGVYKFKSRYYVDAGVSKSILNNAGKLTLNVSDLFNTSVLGYDVNSFGVLSTYRNKIESRFVKLVFSYRFGNQQVKAARARKTSIEKEQRRMESN